MENVIRNLFFECGGSDQTTIVVMTLDIRRLDTERIIKEMMK